MDFVSCRIKIIKQTLSIECSARPGDSYKYSQDKEKLSRKTRKIWGCVRP
jgi:hypothetical protein